MRFDIRLTAFAAAAALALTALPAAAQDLHPSRRPSPLGLARTQVGDTYVKIHYSRPYQRGRDNIFGTAESEALVPFGEVWRTGANEATEITTTGDIVFGEGSVLPAGTYSIFSVPGPEEWTIHFNRALGLNGTARFNPETESFENAFDPANDALTLTVTPTTLADEDLVDQFTIAFEDGEDGAKHMVWRWITTEIRVPVRAAE